MYLNNYFHGFASIPLRTLISLYLQKYLWICIIIILFINKCNTPSHLLNIHNTLTHPTASATLGAATGTLTVYMKTFLCPSLVNNYTHNTVQSQMHYDVYICALLH